MKTILQIIYLTKKYYTKNIYAESYYLKYIKMLSKKNFKQKKNISDIIKKNYINVIHIDGEKYKFKITQKKI